MSAAALTRHHWEQVYATRQPHEVSWTEAEPTASLEFIAALELPAEAPILDVGGGDSHLIDALLAAGYRNLTVLDISGAALARARQRLGPQACAVRWLQADVRDFRPDTTYALWHDRATFHFLTEAAPVAYYLAQAQAALQPGGALVVATFSENGPTSCSGLPVRQYSETDLVQQFAVGFTKLHCRPQVHHTPFQTQQSFTYCSFRRTA